MSQALAKWADKHEEGLWYAGAAAVARSSSLRVTKLSR